MGFAVYFLFGIIILYSVYQIFVVDRRSYSINKFIWFYVLLFWGIASLVQYSMSIFSWDVTINDNTAFKSNMLILIFLITYRITYKCVLNKDTIDQNEYKLSKFTITNKGLSTLIVFQVLIFLFFLIHNHGLLLVRGAAEDVKDSTSQPIQMVLEHVLRAFSTFVSFLIFWFYKQEKNTKKQYLLIISLLLLIFTNFPLALARYMAGAFYIGLLFIAKPIYKRRSLPMYALIFIFLFVFPLMTLARYVTALSDLQVDSSMTLLSAFTSGDFDNFSTLNMTILYVDNNGITFGKQLLGVLLFFVPRSLWYNKPIGSGAFMATAKSQDFTNISCPIVGEGYINFGYLGVIVFAMIIGYFSAKMDYTFYHNKKYSLLHLFYPVTFGMIIFILRGDLMSSWSYTVSFLVAALAVFYLSKPFIIDMENNNLKN